MVTHPAILAAQAAKLVPAQQSAVQVAQVAAAAKTFQFAAPNVLLMGPAGTGKTYALASAVEAGLEVFYLALENGIESLLGYWADQGKPIPKNLHWHVIRSSNSGFDAMAATALQINTLTFEQLSKVTDAHRSKNDKFREILLVLNNFYCQRTKKHFGDVGTWDTSRMIAIDGLTGISDMAMTLTVGNKPVKGQNEWGVAQTQVMALLKKLCDDCPCWFTLISHIEREVDPNLGGVKLMPATLGKAIAPKISSLFSDVILAERHPDGWCWSTSNPQADLKTRNLPYSGKLLPDFGAIVKKWEARKKIADMLANGDEAVDA